MYRAKGHSHTGQAEIQPTALLAVNRSQCCRAAQGRIAVPVVPEVVLSLQQREHDTRSTVVQRVVSLVVDRGVPPGQADLGGAR